MSLLLFLGGIASEPDKGEHHGRESLYTVTGCQNHSLRVHFSTGAYLQYNSTESDVCAFAWQSWNIKHRVELIEIATVWWSEQDE